MPEPSTPFHEDLREPSNQMPRYPAAKATIPLTRSAAKQAKRTGIILLLHNGDRNMSRGFVVKRGTPISATPSIVRTWVARTRAAASSTWTT